MSTPPKEKEMTVAQMRVVMNKYKRDNCPPMPKTKPAMIKLFATLKLPTTNVVETKKDKEKEKESKYLSTMTRKDLIENIVMINKAHKSTYNDWSKRDLMKHYRDLRKNAKAAPRVPGVVVAAPSYADQLAEIQAEEEAPRRGPSQAVLDAFKRKKKK